VWASSFKGYQLLFKSFLCLVESNLRKSHELSLVVDKNLCLELVFPSHVAEYCSGVGTGGISTGDSLVTFDKQTSEVAYVEINRGEDKQTLCSNTPQGKPAQAHSDARACNTHARKLFCALYDTPHAHRLIAIFKDVASNARETFTAHHLSGFKWRLLRKKNVCIDFWLYSAAAAVNACLNITTSQQSSLLRNEKPMLAFCWSWHGNILSLRLVMLLPVLRTVGLWCARELNRGNSLINMGAGKIFSRDRDSCGFFQRRSQKWWNFFLPTWN